MSFSLGCLSNVEAWRNVNWKWVNDEKLEKGFRNVQVMLQWKQSFAKPLATMSHTLFAEK